MDGGMLLTPDAQVEPSRPPMKTGILMWHPKIWDIHFWIGKDVPADSFNNPQAPDGRRLCLPAGSFYVLKNGRKEPSQANSSLPSLDRALSRLGDREIGHSLDHSPGRCATTRKYTLGP
jgi:hypothetical protein